MKRYPKYKDSGIEWLGEVPEEWEVKKLKWIARLEYGSSLSEEAREGGSVHVFGSNGIVGEHSKSITDKPVIIIGRKGSYGKISYSDVPCFPIDTTYYIDPCLTKGNIRWLYYVLSSMALDEITFDTGVPGLSREFAYGKIVPFPSKNEQTAIANFLDHKTAKIDELIKKNETLVELLKEKRQAIISHAVTKGIPPHPNPLPRGERGLLHFPPPLMGGGEGEGVKRDLKMKDSWIEWRGEVPVGWEVKRLKYVANVNPEALGETIPLDYEIRYVDISNVNEEGLIDESELMLFGDAPSRARRIIKKEDVIVSTVRTYLKAIAYFPMSESNLIVSTGFAVLRVSNIIKAKLLYYFVRSDFFVESIMANSVGVSYPAINSSVLAGLPILVPPKNQQSEIIKFLDKQTKKYNDLMKKILSQTATLKEYRQALISNVVTGKVRVDEN